MNVELLQKVKSHILEEPRRFNLDYWGGVIDPKAYEQIDEGWANAEELGDIIAYQRPPCGAVGCIAGNTCILAEIVVPSQHFNGPEVYELLDNTLELAAGALDISKESAQRLFFLTDWHHRDAFGSYIGWPAKFEDELAKYDAGTIDYAQVAADRIDHLITTNGAE